MEQVQGYIVMESAMEPMKPKIIETVNEPNMFYVRFRTCLQSFDCFNRNKRNYNLRPMMEAVKADHIQELLYKGTWCGENGHPDSTDIKRILSIDMTKICHRIIDLEFQGNLLYGTIETLNDDAWGKQFTKHILQGLHPSFSLRALAAITKLGDGRGIIKTKPHIVTYDRVILPSHREAYMDNSKPITLVQSATESATIQESYIPEGNTFDDSVHEVNESTIASVLDYVKEESSTFKELATFFDANYDSVSLVDESKVCINDDDRKIIVCLEDYIRHDIASFMSDINKMIN